MEKESIENISQVEYDPWNVAWEANPNEIQWKEMNWKQKVYICVSNIIRLATVLGMLYVFIISLDMLGNAFKVLGGHSAGQIFQNSKLFKNPIAGLVIGILATVMVQSSGTSTSIIVTMTAADIMSVDQAVFLIMGANIGTSVTSTIVAISQVDDAEQFRRSFAAATVHYMFNLLTVIVLLPVEWGTHVLRRLSSNAVASMQIHKGDYEQTTFLKVITGPATSGIISVDKKLINEIGKEKNATRLSELVKQPMVKWKNCKIPEKSFIFCHNQNMSDGVVGTILLIFSLVLLCSSLVLLIKIMQNSLKRGASKILYKSMNLEISYPFGFLSDYVLLIVGFGITILVHSSSVTTATLTPVVGFGLLKLDKMFPVTVGANIATTTTGIMAAMAGKNLRIGLIVSFCHLFFNLFGIIFWFIVPSMRQIPIRLAMFMGNTTSKYRWFAIFFIFMAFVIGPLFFLGLAEAGMGVMFGILIPIVILLLVHGIILILRSKKSETLPDWLKEYKWLPQCIRKEPAFLKRYHEYLKRKARANELSKSEKAKNKSESFETRFLKFLGNSDKLEDHPVEMVTSVEENDEIVHEA